MNEKTKLIKYLKKQNIDFLDAKNRVMIFKNNKIYPIFIKNNFLYDLKNRRINNFNLVI